MLVSLVVLLCASLSARGAVHLGQFVVDVGDSLPSCQRGNTQACTLRLRRPWLRRADWSGTDTTGGWAIVRSSARPLLTIAGSDTSRLDQPAFRHAQVG